jgi:hypothetical protein
MLLKFKHLSEKNFTTSDDQLFYFFLYGFQ